MVGEMMLQREDIDMSVRSAILEHEVSTRLAQVMAKTSIRDIGV